MRSLLPLKLTRRYLRFLDYDQEPLSPDQLFTKTGIEIVALNYHYQLNSGVEIEWDTEELRRRTGPMTDLELCRYVLKERAKKATLATSRINLGVQVSNQIGYLASSVAGIRVIGAESRLEERSTKRGIRDLDLMIDCYREPDERELSWIMKVKEHAQSKTEVPIDIICPGMELTQDNLEHIMAVFDVPLITRGIPVFWRNLDYLRSKLKEKNRI